MEICVYKLVEDANCQTNNNKQQKQQQQRSPDQQELLGSRFYFGSQQLPK